jgi:hypothetical protein
LNQPPAARKNGGWASRVISRPTKNGPIAGATIKRGKVEGLTQEWQCGEPIRRPERQQERCSTKQRVKVMLVSGLFWLLLQVHLRNQSERDQTAGYRIGSKLLQDMHLGVI